MKAALQSVEHLGKFERLQLVEDLWDEFAGDTGPETVVGRAGGEQLAGCAALGAPPFFRIRRTPVSTLLSNLQA